jgi:hypothetical protein
VDLLQSVLLAPLSNWYFGFVWFYYTSTKTKKQKSRPWLRQGSKVETTKPTGFIPPFPIHRFIEVTGMCIAVACDIDDNPVLGQRNKLTRSCSTLSPMTTMLCRVSSKRFSVSNSVVAMIPPAINFHQSSGAKQELKRM